MSRPDLADAFAHHVWATVRLVDACLPLSPEQLDATAEGTYGSIIATMRHLIGGDASYLWVLTDGLHVVFRLAETRESTLIQQMLDGYAGMLISDFYGA